MQKIKSSKKSRNLLLKIALCIFLAYVVGMLVNLQSQISNKKQEYSDLQTQILLQQAENEAISRSLEIDDEEYIEQYAREELDMAKQGDRIFVNIAGN